VGISTAFFFIVEVQQAANRLASKIVRYQMAMVTNQMSCLAAPRNMKRFDNAREKALRFMSEFHVSRGQHGSDRERRM
jgi:hypothetical protein